MQPGGSSSRLARGHGCPHAYGDLLDRRVRPARSDQSSPNHDHFELHPFGSQSRPFASRSVVAGRSAAWLNAKVVASVRIAKRHISFVVETYLPPAQMLRADLVAINAQNARGLKRRPGREADPGYKTLVSSVIKPTKKVQARWRKECLDLPLECLTLSKGVALWI
jgi:hypothetical protein